MNSKQKVRDFIKDKETNKNYWYTGQHEWSVPSLCYGVSILKEYQDEKDEKLTTFYKKRAQEIKHKNQDLKISETSRGLINAHYIGLMDGIEKNNTEKTFTDVFNLIDKKVDNKFENVNSYKDIIENQMEKMYLQRRLPDKKQAKNNKSNILVHPLFVLYKVLITIQKYTKQYEISMAEFKLFVCFIESYNDIYKIVEYIIISRLIDENEIKKSVAKVGEIRIHLALKQLETLDFNTKSIKLNSQFIDEVKGKVDKYEREVLPKINKENMDKALNDVKNIFDFYKGV
ncbi:hypothetical protein AXY37_06195 [Mammaliicoccus lentus]|uniref:hypothetical protein n=1 Tax=Mammaliicoccus lentus TaxID=42858 RepID=UPI0007D99111|nr:hypothetical protein [Mammaliicoccus lentus]OAO31466.1 hypothetical protein AXY37_06195 [Mammaliicoccus lentus]